MDTTPSTTTTTPVALWLYPAAFITPPTFADGYERLTYVKDNLLEPPHPVRTLLCPHPLWVVPLPYHISTIISTVPCFWAPSSWYPLFHTKTTHRMLKPLDVGKSSTIMHTVCLLISNLDNFWWNKLPLFETQMIHSNSKSIFSQCWQRPTVSSHDEYFVTAGEVFRGVQSLFYLSYQSNRRANRSFFTDKYPKKARSGSCGSGTFKLSTA